jgi:Sortase domain
VVFSCAGRRFVTSYFVATLTVFTTGITAVGLPQAAVSATSKRTTTTRPVVSMANRPRPRQLRLDSIQLDRPISIKPLKLDRKKKLESPKDTKSIGWYHAAGPVILVGHVDSSSGPGVFYKLKNMKRGDIIEVDYTDGTSVSYVASQVSTFPKNKFPTDLVYRAKSSDIRIVTCGGKFNRKTGHYVDNVIVVASPAPTPT